jgi:hypothetical protein
MRIDIQKFKAVAQEAKAKTNDKRWRAAIDKAVAGVESGWWIVTELANCYAITTEEGRTYFANGQCQCEAYKRNQPCKHRCAARILDLMAERPATFADVEIGRRPFAPRPPRDCDVTTKGISHDEQHRTTATSERAG